MICLNQAHDPAGPKNSSMDADRSFLPATDALSRPRAIDRIRQILNALEDDERCACAIASRYGIFCKGFDNLSDEQFRQRFYWIARKRPKATCQELEQLVSLYYFGRRQVTGATVCCDVETREHCACDGWNSFDNKALEELCLQLTQRQIRIG